MRHTTISATMRTEVARLFSTRDCSIFIGLRSIFSYTGVDIRAIDGFHVYILCWFMNAYFAAVAAKFNNYEQLFLFSLLKDYGESVSFLSLQDSLG